MVGAWVCPSINPCGDHAYVQLLVIAKGVSVRVKHQVHDEAEVCGMLQGLVYRSERRVQCGNHLLQLIPYHHFHE